MTENVPTFGTVPFNMDIPFVQPLTFYLDYSNASYMDREMTPDEHTHQYSQSVIDTITKYRVLQPANIKQGTAGLYKYELKFWDHGSPADLTGKMLRFIGTDADGFYRDSVDGFDTTQGNLGMINWSPNSEIAASAGRYKNAYFVIENADRTRALKTLDFTLEVIPNDVPIPKVAEHYISEYYRLLVQFSTMQRTGQRQLDYILGITSQVVNDNLDTINKQVNAQIDKNDTQLAEADKRVTDFLADLQIKFKTVSDQFDVLAKKIDEKDLATKGDITIAINDVLGSSEDEELTKIETELGIDIDA